MNEVSPAAAAGLGESIRKRSVKIAGHSTSLSLEGVFWDALKEVAAARRLSLNALIEEIDRGRGANLSSAVRVYLLNHYRRAAADGEANPRGGRIAGGEPLSLPGPSAGS